MREERIEDADWTLGAGTTPTPEDVGGKEAAEPDFRPTGKSVP